MNDTYWVAVRCPYCNRWRCRIFYRRNNAEAFANEIPLHWEIRYSIPGY